MGSGGIALDSFMAVNFEVGAPDTDLQGKLPLSDCHLLGWVVFDL